MTASQMWKKYTSVSPCVEAYTAWAFGDLPDRLAQLVLEGTKTATASAYPLYVIGDEELPSVGEYSVILDSNDNAVCVIRNTSVVITPFDQVSHSHAWKEGEGDRSLSYWRRVHEDLFSLWLREAGLDFDTKMLVVGEEFVRVYP